MHNYHNNNDAIYDRKGDYMHNYHNNNDAIYDRKEDYMRNYHNNNDIACLLVLTRDIGVWSS